MVGTTLQMAGWNSRYSDNFYKALEYDDSIRLLRLVKSSLMSYGSVSPVTEGVPAERVSQDIGAGHMFKPGTAHPGRSAIPGLPQLQEPCPTSIIPRRHD